MCSKIPPVSVYTSIQMVHGVIFAWCYSSFQCCYWSLWLALSTGSKLKSRGKQKNLSIQASSTTVYIYSGSCIRWLWWVCKNQWSQWTWPVIAACFLDVVNLRAVGINICALSLSLSIGWISHLHSNLLHRQSSTQVQDAVREQSILSPLKV